MVKAHIEYMYNSDSNQLAWRDRLTLVEHPELTRTAEITLARRP